MIDYGYTLRVETTEFGDVILSSIYFFERKTGRLAAIFDVENSLSDGKVFVDIDLEIQKFQN